MRTPESFLDEYGEDLRLAVEQAEVELAPLLSQVHELRLFIERGRSLLEVGRGEAGPRSESSTSTLHEAMLEVLGDFPSRGASPKQIASLVNERGLYRMKDGRPVEPGQIQARVGNYRWLFDKEDGLIMARYDFQTASAPSFGAYTAAVTTVTRRSDSETMRVEARCAYSVRLPDGETLESHVLKLSRDQAFDAVKGEQFLPYQSTTRLMTTNGWQAVNMLPSLAINTSERD